VVGHDSPEPLYDSTLAETGRKKISLLFGGIRDCRNVHCTFMHILEDRLNGRLKGQTFHLTLVDIKPAVIARDLVLFLLMDDLSKVIRTNPSKRSLLQARLYYAYLSPTMPG
jgi:hypothetical protein